MQSADVFPVVHVESVDQVRDDLAIVADAGLEHAFLIDHDADDDRLAAAVTAAARAYPKIAIGVNVIRRPAHEAVAVLAARLGSLDGVWAIWADSLGLESGQARDWAEALAAARVAYSWSGTVFGGVAFKYQAPVSDEDLPRLARAAGELDVVPTTSGSATGSAPSTDKLRLLRQGLSGGRLAVASGVMPDNVADFLPYVTDILVSTGISGPDGRLSPDRLAALLAELRA